MEINRLTMYTGNLRFRDVDYSFSFDGQELRLIPPEKKKFSILQNLTMTEVSPGMYIQSNPTPIEEVVIIGSCNETNSQIVFFPDRGNYISHYHFSICVPLIAFMLYSFNRELIDRITFIGPEINHIHPVKTGVSLSISDNYHESGVATVSTEAFEATTTDKQYFDVDGKQVDIFFGMWREVSLSNDEPPINMRSAMMFEFEATKDFAFILELLRIAHTFIGFLCYRNNICFSSIKMAAPYKDGKHENFADVFVLSRYEQKESKPIREDRCIKQYLIAGHEGEILSDIAQNQLYIRHLPESYSSGRNINVGRFILLVTGFEWEFSRLYKDEKLQKDPMRTEAENVVSLELSDLIAKYKKTGTSENDDSLNKEIRAILHTFQNHVADITLKDKVAHVGLRLNSIIDCFGEPYYKRDHIPFNYEDIGQRLGSQRNHFAHGDLDKDFIGTSLIDLIFLEYIIYAMQLKYYHIDDTQIKQAVSDLFHRRIVVKSSSEE